MLKYQNIHLADKTLWNQYQTLFKTNITSAHALLSDSSLTDKIFGATEINAITGKIATIENYYKTNIPDTLNQQLDDFNADVSDIVYRGIYDSSATYVWNNVVSYTNQLYYCKIAKGATITNVAPTDTNKWVYLGLRGDQGVPGLGVSLKGLWSATTSYQTKDVVSYNNHLYVATQASTNQIPVSTSAYWALLADYDIPKINFSDTNLETGDIYWEEIS